MSCADFCVAVTGLLNLAVILGGNARIISGLRRGFVHQALLGEEKKTDKQAVT